MTARFARFLLAAAASGFVLPAPAQAVPAKTHTAKLLVAKTAYASPSGSARKVRRVSARTPITRSPTVLEVIGSAQRGNRQWLRVRLPGRPNGSKGWMPADGVMTGTVRTYVRVSLRARTVTVYRDGRRVKTMRAIVGKPSTPTPPGFFFVTERVRQPRGGVLGPWVLALNGYSRVLTEFNGGPGQIALHGRGALGAPLGTAASFGCVRVADGDTRWLARHVPVGTPVRISRSSARAASAGYDLAFAVSSSPAAADADFATLPAAPLWWRADPAAFALPAV